MNMAKTVPTRILIAYSMAATYVSTTLDYLLSLSNISDFEIRYLHVTHGAQIDIDLNEFDVLFHSYCARLCFEGYVSKSYEMAVQKFRGLKIIAVQDEYDNTSILHNAIRRLGFHVFLTCIQPKFWPLVHPKSELPGIKLFQVLTGYVPERLLNGAYNAKPLAERKTLVAYRGRDIGPKYGLLGFEKYEIGRRMIDECKRAGIAHDITMDEKSRIYGDAWFDFVGSARAMLGSESGANSFDFDGKLSALINNFIKKNNRRPSYPEMRELVEPIEKWFDVGQISPRIFECALMRTPMILFRGSYSNAIEPNVHYIALEKDFSNAQEILSRLDDIEYLQGFADRAYDKLIKSGEYNYSKFAEKIHNIINQQFPLWVDPSWIKLRSEIEHYWFSPKIKTKEYCEIPTELPISSRDEFYHRAAKSGYLGGQQIGGRIIKISAKFRISEKFILRTLELIWQLLPYRIRYEILRFRLAR